MKRLRYAAEAALAYPLYGLVAVLPLDAASWLGGFLGRCFGRFTGFHKIALANLDRFLPQSPEERSRTLSQMWDNFGRVLAEYAHLDELWKRGRIEVVGGQVIERLVRDKTAAIFAAGHLGNWEIAPIPATSAGMNLAVAFRKPNNNLVGRLLRIERLRGVTPLLMPKGSEGARALLKHLLDGGSLGLLIDQKMNEGIPVPFFGVDTMTASAAARLSIRTGCPLIPARTQRLKGAHFRLTLYPALEASSGGNAELNFMTKLNQLLEEWIREDPGQWLWLHRRWGKFSSSP